MLSMILGGDARYLRIRQAGLALRGQAFYVRCGGKRMLQA